MCIFPCVLEDYLMKNKPQLAYCLPVESLFSLTFGLHWNTAHLFTRRIAYRILDQRHDDTQLRMPDSSAQQYTVDLVIHQRSGRSQGSMVSVWRRLREMCGVELPLQITEGQAHLYAQCRCRSLTYQKLWFPAPYFRQGDGGMVYPDSPRPSHRP